MVTEHGSIYGPPGSIYGPPGTDHVRVEYEHGRSNGFADGAHDHQWAPHLMWENEKRIREYVDGCRTRRCRAYHLGELRGYREAVGIGGRT